MYSKLFFIPILAIALIFPSICLYSNSTPTPSAPRTSLIARGHGGHIRWVGILEWAGIITGIVPTIIITTTILTIRIIRITIPITPMKITT